jgi:hypothetical protein
LHNKLCHKNCVSCKYPLRLNCISLSTIYISGISFLLHVLTLSLSPQALVMLLSVIANRIPFVSTYKQGDQMSSQKNRPKISLCQNYVMQNINCGKSSPNILGYFSNLKTRRARIRPIWSPCQQIRASNRLQKMPENSTTKKMVGFPLTYTGIKFCTQV